MAAQLKTKGFHVLETKQLIVKTIGRLGAVHTFFTVFRHASV